MVGSLVSTTKSTELPSTTSAGSATAFVTRGGVVSNPTMNRCGGEITEVVELQITIISCSTPS